MPLVTLHAVRRGGGTFSSSVSIGIIIVLALVLVPSSPLSFVQNCKEDILVRT